MTEHYLSRIQNPELAQTIRAAIDQIKVSVAEANHSNDPYLVHNAMKDTIEAVDDLLAMRSSAKLVLDLYTDLAFIDGATITPSYDWENGDDGDSFKEFKLEITDLELMPELECDSVDPDAIGELLSNLIRENHHPDESDALQALSDRIREVYHPDSEEEAGDILKGFNSRTFSGDETSDLYNALDFDGMGEGNPIPLVTTREAVAKAAELGDIDGVAALCFPREWARLSDALNLPQPQTEDAPAAAPRPRAGA